MFQEALSPEKSLNAQIESGFEMFEVLISKTCKL